MKKDIKTAVKYIADRFVYKADANDIIDPWFVMPEQGGKFYGDCDDFAVTALYHALGLWGFIWQVLITHRAELFFCKTRNGGGHAIGKLNGLYFDNWTLKALPAEEFFKSTGHVVKHKYYFYSILPKLFSGWFQRGK